MAAKLYRCMNDECKPDDAIGFDYAGAKACPKCGLDGGNVVELARIHLLVRDSAGPVAGMHGKRFACVCEPARKKFNDRPNEGATGEALAATCPECLATFAATNAAAAATQEV